jgi:surface antigen
VSNKDVKIYVVQPGDTINTLAVKFGVSTNSIRWSNGLSFFASLTVGKSLVIPPVDGVVYTVKSGDTPQSLAQAYAASEALIVADNDAELHGLAPGERIIIPGGTMPQPSYAPSYGGSYANTAGNYEMYATWNCTWWVAYRWAQTGRPIMPLLGNASQWYYAAQRLGMATGRTPRQYAAAVTSTYGYGHVVFIEGVNADGSVNISEMNVNGENTWYPVRYDPTYSTVSAATAAGYLYIY